MISRTTIFKKMNKKGNAVEIIIGSAFLVIFMLVIGVSLFKINDAGKQVKDDLINQFPEDTYNSSRQILIETSQDISTSGDRFFFYLFISVCVALLIAGYFSVDHPLWLVVLFIVFIVLIFVGAYLSNYWYNFTENGDNSANILEFPRTYWILNNIPYILVGLLIGVFITFSLREWYG